MNAPTPAPEQRKVTIFSYIALLFAMVFFSGAFQTTDWYGIFDFGTLNGSFGSVVRAVNDTTEGITTTMTSFRGVGGNGARDGFMFAITLIPSIMLALGVINVLEHFGALDAARQLLSPLLRPLLGIPGNTGLAMIASLQSTDAGASMTRNLLDEKSITKREGDIFTMFQFSAGATITNFFASAAVLYTLTDASGDLVVTASIGITIVLMLVVKVIGANIFRIYLNLTEPKVQASDSTVDSK